MCGARSRCRSGTAPRATARGDGRPRRPDLRTQHPNRTRPSSLRNSCWTMGGLHRLLARAHSGVIGEKHRVGYRHTVDPGDDEGDGCRVAVSGHHDGVVEVLPPPGTAQPPPSNAAHMPTRSPAVIRYRRRRPWRDATGQHTALHQLAHHLLGEKRVPGGPLGDDRRELADRGIRTQQLTDQRCGIRITQGGKHYRSGRRAPASAHPRTRGGR